MGSESDAVVFKCHFLKSQRPVLTPSSQPLPKALPPSLLWVGGIDHILGVYKFLSLTNQVSQLLQIVQGLAHEPANQSTGTSVEAIS